MISTDLLNACPSVYLTAGTIYPSLTVSFEANFRKCKRYLILPVLNLDFCQLLAIFGFQVLFCSALEIFFSVPFSKLFPDGHILLLKQNNSKSSLTNL